ncbi:hypothetical protein M426DRAFT_323751 [Hypoxylon sp. CI-4A]|nr:hypothetical protein M426DRAFT_323751 [Hypoxylon sp. CI-4A]
MRLLHTTSLHLHEFIGKKRPQYAILSHTWGLEEVLFEDIQHRQQSEWKRKAGSRKVEAACHRAVLDGYEYIWIDTCCINKSSSAELSESINSMFAWYRDSSVCYAYIEDIMTLEGLPASRWVTRGWTLQELIAPDDVRFYNKSWQPLGDRYELALPLARMTGINVDVLLHHHIINGEPWAAHKEETSHINRHLLNAHNLSCQSCQIPVFDVGAILEDTPVATKMRWAAKRITTREEDLAYCLLGIFGVSMTLIYGEGLKAAFYRLQEEILKHSDDQSILAWASNRNHPSRFLAIHPKEYWLGQPYIQQKSVVQPVPGLKPSETDSNGMEVTPNKLTLTVLLAALDGDFYEERLDIAILDCVLGSNLLSRPALLLKRLPGHKMSFHRHLSATICIVEPPNLVLRKTGKPTQEYEIIGSIDLEECRSERIAIVKKSPTSIQSSLNPDLLPSKISAVTYLDNLQYKIVDSIPPWTDRQAKTLPPAKISVLAFEAKLSKNRPSTFFVIYQNRGPILHMIGLPELFEWLLDAPLPVAHCTVPEIMDAMRLEDNHHHVGLVYSLFPSFGSGATHRETDFEVTATAERKSFLGNTVLEVQVDFFAPEEVHYPRHDISRRPTWRYQY